MRVEATNFQSWPEFSVEVEGLTVIVGPSNLGKSAMFRALRGAVRNEIEAVHIRKGTDTATVTLHHDGHEATAVRTAKSTSYRIKLAGQEEREVGKLNGATPEDMASWGFNTVDIGGVALDPVFAAQFDKQRSERSVLQMVNIAGQDIHIHVETPDQAGNHRIIRAGTDEGKS